MQRPSEESGMGATLGGNAVTSILGGEGVNTLARITKYCVILFFSLSFFLSLFHMAFEEVDRPQNLLEKREIVETHDMASNETPEDSVAVATGEELINRETLNETDEITVDSQNLNPQENSFAAPERETENTEDEQTIFDESLKDFEP
jgi:preprotein translocase subunit SecG